MTPPCPYLERAVQPSALHAAISLVAVATLWLAAQPGVGPRSATLSEGLQTGFCFGSSRLPS